MLDVSRRIRENIHGTIDVSPLEDIVLAHPFVQRMRRIKQLAFLQYVFPGASHSRFEHSLGVMYLAGVAWNKLEENQRSLAKSAAKYENFSELELKSSGQNFLQGRLSPTFAIIDDIFQNPYHLQALRLAALLHDLGHSPYSHSGEEFMPSWQSMLDASHDYPGYLVTYLKSKIEAFKIQKKDPSAIKVRHEIFTVLLLDKLFLDVYSANPQYAGIRIDAQDVASLIISEIPPTEMSPLRLHGVHNICHELLSSELDVDRMDYLLRDSRECGVVYGIFDESRILNSLAVYWDDQTGSLHLAIQFSGLAAFEDYLRARHSMYLQLYFHKTSVAAEAMIRRVSRILGDWFFPTDVNSYAEIDETNLPVILLDASQKMIKNQSEKVYFDRLLRDLFFDRNLWKRVFEVASNNGVAEGVESIDEAATVIASMGAKFEKVSSSSSLTRFRPRQADSVSSNSLRLIKKDHFQFPRVIPIEDQLSLVDANSQVHITRLYVENTKDTKSGKNLSDLVKAELQKLVRRP